MVTDDLATRLVHDAAETLAQHRRLGCGTSCMCGERFGSGEAWDARPAAEAHQARAAVVAVLEALATNADQMPFSNYSPFELRALAERVKEVRNG